MPQIKHEVYVPVPPDVAFAVSQTTGEVRLRWDPFVKVQHLLDGAERPGKGVRTFTKSREGLRMVSKYVSYNPPTNVGMTMLKGPWFLQTFGGGWRFTPEGDGTRAVWKYTFTVKPAWLRRIADPIGVRMLGRDIEQRITAFAKACSDPQVLAAVRE